MERRVGTDGGRGRELGFVVTVFSDVTRSDPSPAAHGECHYKFLDRVAGVYWDQVRDLIEDWFSHLPPDDQADVSGRLRGKDDRHFNGAFFELYVHESLLRMGYTVTCHPVLEGTPRRPDFMAEKDGRRLYVEARSASASDVLVSGAARVNAVYESLDKLDSPNFFLWIEVVRQGPGMLGAGPLRKMLKAWFDDLDPDSVAVGGPRDELPRYRYQERPKPADSANAHVPWVIDFWAIPKSRDGRGREGVRPLGIFGSGGGKLVEDKDSILGALSDKGAAYGPLGAPFVVAVASTSMSLDDYDVLDALYGTEEAQAVTAPDGSETIRYVREPDGYWNAGDYWQHRGVSAVLVVKGLHPAKIGAQRHTVWEHPDPEHAVDAMPIWRRAMYEPDSRDVAFIEPTRSQSDWFCLGDPWPVGDPYPPRS